MSRFRLSIRECVSKLSITSSFDSLLIESKVHSFRLCLDADSNQEANLDADSKQEANLNRNLLSQGKQIIGKVESANIEVVSIDNSLEYRLKDFRTDCKEAGYSSSVIAKAIKDAEEESSQASSLGPASEMSARSREQRVHNVAGAMYGPKEWKVLPNLVQHTAGSQGVEQDKKVNSGSLFKESRRLRRKKMNINTLESTSDKVKAPLGSKSIADLKDVGYSSSNIKLVATKQHDSAPNVRSQLKQAIPVTLVPLVETFGSRSGVLVIRQTNSENEQESDTNKLDENSSDEENLDENTIRSRIVSSLKNDNKRLIKRFDKRNMTIENTLDNDYFKDFKVFPRKSSRMKKCNSKYRL